MRKTYRVLAAVVFVWLWVLTTSVVYAAQPDYTWYIRMIRADEAWAQGWTGKGVSVGVLDTGVDTTLPGFGNRLKAMEFIDRAGFYSNLADPGQPFDPWNIYQTSGSYYLSAGGHGTAVASLIGGYLVTPLSNGTNWTYKGIAYESLLRVGSLRNNPEAGKPGYPYNSGGIAGEIVGEPKGPIDWLLGQNVRIVNNSWGSSSKITDFNLTDKNPVTLGYLSQSSLDGWRKAVNNSMLVVFSAGNDGGNPQYYNQPSLEGGLPYLYPELRKSWINAVALKMTGQTASYSQPAGVAAAWTLSAPGGEWAENLTVPHDLTGIPAYRSRNMNALNGQPFDLSAYNLEGDDFLLPDGTVANESSMFKQFLGTSAAAPVISAGAALVMQAHSDYTAQMVAQTLFTTANHAGIYADSTTYGWGLMDLAEAVKGPKYLRRALLIGLNPDYAKGQLVADVPAGTHPSFNNGMTGDGGLAKTGAGSLTLTGSNNYTGDTDILAGTLYVDGTLSASEITLSSGAALGGRGTITAADGLIISGGAALAPGHSPSTLTVNGDVEQMNGSFLQPDLAGNRYSSTLAVTGAGHRYGLATDGSGVALRPQLWNGYAPAVGDGWTLVTAPGGIVGTFASVTLPAAFPVGQTVDILYGANSIVSYATPVNYRVVTPLGWSWNRNQRQVASIWQVDRPVQAAALTAVQAPLYGTLFTLNASGLQDAASQMSGQLIADTQAASLDLLRGYNRNLAAMLREEPYESGSCNVRQYRQWSHVATQDVSGRDVQGNGTVVNCDLVNKPRYRAGIGFASLKGSAVSLSGPGIATVEQTGGHVYAQYRPGKYYVEGQAGVGRTNGSHDRHLTAWGMSANGQAGGQHWIGRVAVGQEQVTSKQRQDLSLALLGEIVARDGFTENGDALLRAASGATRDQRVAAELAYGRSFLSGSKPGKGFHRTYDYKVGYVHEFRNTRATSSLTWRGEPLSIVSQELGSDAVQAGVGASWETAKGWKLSAGLQGEWRRFSSQLSVNASLNYRW